MIAIDIVNSSVAVVGNENIQFKNPTKNAQQFAKYSPRTHDIAEIPFRQTYFHHTDVPFHFLLVYKQQPFHGQ